MNKRIKKVPVFMFMSIVCLTCIVIFFLNGCMKKNTDSATPQEENKQTIAAPTPVLVPVPGFFVYENSTYGIRVQYPENWKKVEGEHGVAFLIPSRGEEEETLEGLNILFERMYGAQMSLDQYMKITREGMQNYMPGFKFIASEESTLGGHPCVEMTFTGLHEVKTMKFLSIFTIRNGNIYSLSFNTFPERFDSLKKTLDTIINSFQFIS